MKTYLIVGILVALVLVVGFQAYQISTLKDSITGNAVSTGSIDMTGWTANEKMMYEHHGTLPARLQSGQPSSGSGMVGGC